jgi:FKBP-type peptidyl-prolyl cis-trans isomerase FklB
MKALAPLVAIMTASAFAQTPPAADASSYDLGLLLGNQLANSGLQGSLAREAFMRGVDEALQGKTPSAEQREAAQQFAHAARKTLATHNSQAAHEFLTRNAKVDGVKTTASGLQYRVLEAGAAQAPSPGPTDQVNLRYVASLADGTVLDRSEAHAQAPVFRVNSVIPAWREALLAMKPGARWQLFVPPELGYGVDSPPPLPPGALIVYDLELLQVDATPRMAPRPGAP